MAEIHYLISDAAKKVDVETHVLRYWEDELALEIPRNELGHRYYTELHIRLFQKIKELKEKGYQLKAIKTAINRMLYPENGSNTDMSGDVLEEDMDAALKETAVSTIHEEKNSLGEAESTAQKAEKMVQFQQIMNQIISQAIEQNSEKLSQDISYLVNERIAKELDYQMRINDEKEEERFKQLDEMIRSYQKDNKGRAEAAAGKISFFKKKRFGRNGKKL